MEQHNFQTQLQGIDKQVPFLWIMLLAKGIHYKVHIKAHQTAFLKGFGLCLFDLAGQRYPTVYCRSSQSQKFSMTI
jgi:hypothetical protein